MSDITQLQDIIRGANKVHVCGAKTKSGFHDEGEAVNISMSGLRGVVSYDPQEFVVTLWAGTPLSELTALLGQQGQYLPFDPLLVDRNATIGGTIASNASGPGRFRFGGIRDFLIGVRFLDGQGNKIRGGGQVVKNAAGFDYPKLMVGSQGKLGAIYEVTFKVFPKPENYATVIYTFEDLDSALKVINQLASSAMDVEAMDLLPQQSSRSGYELAVRIGGIADAIPSRLKRLKEFGKASKILNHDDGNDVEETLWRSARNLDWVPSGSTLQKIPITPNTIPSLENRLSKAGVHRRYSVGGNVAWIVSEGTMEFLNHYPSAQTFLGRSSTNPIEPGPFGKALRRALDPDNKFV